MKQTSTVAPRQASFRMELLGEFRLLSGGEPILVFDKARLQSLLGYLILHNEAPQSREHLAFMMWPDSGDAQARTNLRHLLHHLRRTLPAECGSLIADHRAVQWRRGSTCTVDVVEFDNYLLLAEQVKGSDRQVEMNALSNAARLYKDDLLPALYDEWLRNKRERYRQMAARVFERLASLLEDRQDYPEAIRYAERLVSHDPISEAHYQCLIRLHAANGDRASAVRAFHQCRATLRRDLGIEPSATTRGLFEQVLKLDKSLASEAHPAASIAESQASTIGRKKEWQKLLEHWKVASRGGPHMFVIQGDPGIGKSHLAQQLYVLGKRENVGVAQARCYAAQGRLAYAPVAEWLTADPLREACAQLPKSQALELARVVPEALSERHQLPGPQSMREGWERRLFYDALAAAFGKAQKPLLLILDDVQWCDPDSLEWLHSLFRAELNGGVLVVVTCRQNELVRGHPFTRLLGELRLTGQAQELALVPLDSTETAELGSQTGNRQLNDTEAAELYRATQGNPLFIVESIRSGRAGTTSAVAPSRVHAVIVERLAQLTSPAHELAGYISAIGQAFSVDLVAKATDWDDESLTNALDELWQRRIVEHKAGAEYDFTHDLLREATYAELSPIRKRFLHRRLARALEELHSAAIESAGKIAAHYAQGDMAEEAIRYYLTAGRAAHQRYADREAAAEFRRALALCRELPPTIARKEQELELLVGLQRTLLITHGYAAPEVGEASRRAVALFRELDARPQGVPVLNCAFLFHVVRGEIASAKQVSDDLLELAAADKSAISSLAAQFGLGCAQFHLGRHDLSQQHFEQALRDESRCTSEELALFPAQAVRVFCEAYLSHLLWHRGKLEQAVAISEETIATASEAHPFALAIALNYGAMLQAFRCDIESAQSRAQAAVDLCKRYDIAYYSSTAEIVAGWSHAMRGNPAVGLAGLRSGFEALRASGAELRLPFYHALAAEAHGRAEQPGEALAHISDGLAFLAKNGEAWAAPYLHLVHGDLLQQADNPQEALSHYCKALEAAEQTGAHSLALRSAVRICEIDPEPYLPVVRRLFGQFTEGFDSQDLVDARHLLSGMAGAAAMVSE